MQGLACSAIAGLLMTLVANGFAATEEELLKQGYRWVTVDGPYACVSVDDLRRITREGGDDLELKLVQQLKAYYLVQGTMVQVIQEDKSAGVSQIRIDGIIKPLWTRNAYLSRRPSKSAIGRLAVPGGSPGIVGQNPAPGVSPSASPTPSATP
jgi:hypothetical protein